MTRKIAPKLTHVIEMAWRYDRRFDDAEIEGALRELRALLAVASAVSRAKRHAWDRREDMEKEIERAFAAHDRLLQASKESHEI